MKPHATIPSNTHQAGPFYQWSADVLTRAENNLALYSELVNQLGTNPDYAVLWPGIQLKEQVDALVNCAGSTVALSLYKELYHKLTGITYNQKF